MADNENRYDFMQESRVCDEDGLPYPDILSVNYSDFAIENVPLFQKVSAGDISKFWIYMHKNYNRPDLDDVLLNMNGVPYVGMLEPGSILANFDINDIKAFCRNKRKEVE